MEEIKERDGLSFKIDTKTLKGIAEMVGITLETDFAISNNGLRIVAFSETEYWGSVIEVEKKFLNDLNGEGLLGINTKQFLESVSLLEEETVELWVENLSRLWLIEEKQKLFIDLINVERKRQFDTTKTKYPAHFEIDSKELGKIIKSAAKFNLGHAKIEYDGNASLFRFTMDKRIAGIEKQLAVVKSSGASGRGTFLVRALGETIMGAEGVISVETGNEMAIKFLYQVANAKVVGVVAPRVDREGD